MNGKVKLQMLYFLSLWILKKYPALDASRIWNCNESSFPTDANKGTVVAPMEFFEPLKINLKAPATRALRYNH